MVGDVTLFEFLLNSTKIQNVFGENEFVFCTNMYLIRQLLGVTSLLESCKVHYRLHVIVVEFFFFFAQAFLNLASLLGSFKLF